jgi:hypothetical protein
MSSRRLTFGLLTLVLAVTVRGPLLAQLPTPPPGNGFISGQVVKGGTTRAVPGAALEIDLETR